MTETTKAYGSHAADRALEPMSIPRRDLGDDAVREDTGEEEVRQYDDAGGPDLQDLVAARGLEAGGLGVEDSEAQR